MAWNYSHSTAKKIVLSFLPRAAASGAGRIEGGFLTSWLELSKADKSTGGGGGIMGKSG